MATWVKFWPVLVNFYLDFHKFFSYHVIMAANFEKIFISPGFH